MSQFYLIAFSLLLSRAHCAMIPISQLSMISFRHDSPKQEKTVHTVPLHDYALVEIDNTPSITSGLVLLQNEPNIGRILAVGPGVHHPFSGKHISMHLSPGDRVMFGNYNEKDIVRGNKKHILLHQSNVLLKVSEEDKPTFLQCLPNTLLVQAIEAEYPSGLLASASVSPTTAVVIAVGEHVHEPTGTALPCPVHVGDKVRLASTHAGIEVKLRGEKYIVLRYDDLVAKHR